MAPEHGGRSRMPIERVGRSILGQSAVGGDGETSDNRGRFSRGVPMRVGLFVTCLIDTMRPEIGFSTIKLLEEAGYAVDVPPAQTCCGQPAYNSGERALARDLAEKTLREFEQYDYVVVPSGSCGGMIRAHYGDLFRDDPELMARYGKLRERVYELTDFLVNVAKVMLKDGEFRGPVTYHDSCSGLRELGVKAQPRVLLAQRGVAVREMKDCEHCCGFGGTFAVKYGAISTAIADEKCMNVQASGAGAVVLGDLGCMLNIEGRLRRTGDASTRVLHIAQVLAGDV
jgi:L-lactate dehydrogenase complex protein LldE